MIDATISGFSTTLAARCTDDVLYESMDSRPPRTVADLLLTAVPDLNDRLLEHRIRRAWSHIVGVDAARRTQARSFAEGCLTVAVDNSPWLHELTLRSEELTRRLQQRFDGVRSLRF